ncbi:MAG: ABC transporter ATP-binding protein [Blautia sp.]|uniref:ABC transporter ATP-binding protein n=1 Tax=Blautia sp. TaxID=1955243 RepID=UPI00257A7784|nr:ABC transporter ATP-binding protein [Blautia sp.]MBS5123710.1 ABC transporter ATP-binding protein [Blautia sp.]
MIKLMKYLKKSAGYVALIIALLFLQAYCDLSLPDYTSKIVNIGIQQKGIEDGVPEKIRKTSMDGLELFMSQEDISQLETAYTEDGELYVLKDIDKDTRASLNEILGKPMLMLGGLTMENEASGEMLAQMGIPEGADPVEAVAQMPEDARAQMTESMGEKFRDMPDSMITQAAVSYVQAEYEALGEDIDELQMKYIGEAGLKMILMALLIMAASISVVFLSAKVAASLGHDIRGDIYRKVIGFSSNEYNKFSTASLITRSTNDVQQVQMTMAMMFRIVLYAPIIGIGGVLRVLETDSSMTWILGVGVVLILVIIGLLFSIAMPRFTKLQTLIDRLNLVTREILTGIPVIRAFSREKHEEDRFEDANKVLTKTNLFVNRCMTFMMPSMMLIMNGISVLIVYNGSYAVDAGNMQVGDMMAFIQYAMQIIMAFLMITAMSIMLPRANVAAMRIVEILETENSLKEPEAPVHPSEEIKGTVEFDHVSFAYPDAGENVLTDISFKAEKGQTLAVIGSTGSGKSSLINLIPRFYDVIQGCVKVDGVDVRSMSQKELRDRLGYVPQKGVLFSGTIDSNIRYGKKDISEEQVKKAAMVAQAQDFIEEKPHGYESPVAQGGTNVSGGQKQRLSIARAVAKDPEIFIFDDSFSALDFKTDKALRKALKEHTKNATTIIVAQRISTILNADQILVLDDGKMAGLGTHRELMKNCEVYRQIAMSQLSEEELANE